MRKAESVPSWRALPLSVVGWETEGSARSVCAAASSSADTAPVSPAGTEGRKQPRLEQKLGKSPTNSKHLLFPFLFFGYIVTLKLLSQFLEGDEVEIHHPSAQKSTSVFKAAVMGETQKPRRHGSAPPHGHVLK